MKGAIIGGAKGAGLVLACIGCTFGFVLAIDAFGFEEAMMAGGGFIACAIIVVAAYVGARHDRS